MRTFRLTVSLMLIALLAGSVLAQKSSKSKTSMASMLYLPVESSLVPYQSEVFVGKRLMIRDRYGKRGEQFSKTAQRLGLNPDTHVIFMTSASHGSDMLLYVRRTDKQNINVLSSASPQDQITIYGKLAAYSYGLRHFELDRVNPGWNPPPVLTIRLDQQKPSAEPKIFRIWAPEEWTLPYPDKKNPLKVKIKYLDPETPVPVKDSPEFYTVVAASLIPYQPAEYVNRFIEVKDCFADKVSDFSQTARRLGFTSQTHVSFHTLRGGQGSDMRCYIKKSNRRAVELLNVLVKDVQITVFGRLVGEAHLLRHFEVRRLELGWDAKRQIEVTLSQGDSQYPAKLIRVPGSYAFKFPNPDNPLIIRFEY